MKLPSKENSREEAIRKTLSSLAKKQIYEIVLDSDRPLRHGELAERYRERIRNKDYQDATLSYHLKDMVKSGLIGIKRFYDPLRPQFNATFVYPKLAVREAMEIKVLDEPKIEMPMQVLPEPKSREELIKALREIAPKEKTKPAP